MTIPGTMHSPAMKLLLSWTLSRKMMPNKKLSVFGVWLCDVLPLWSDTPFVWIRTSIHQRCFFCCTPPSTPFEFWMTYAEIVRKNHKTLTTELDWLSDESIIICPFNKVQYLVWIAILKLRSRIEIWINELMTKSSHIKSVLFQRSKQGWKQMTFVFLSRFIIFFSLALVYIETPNKKQIRHVGWSARMWVSLCIKNKRARKIEWLFVSQFDSFFLTIF